MKLTGEIREQLDRGLHFQFCAFPSDPVLGQVAILACPMQDESGSVGHLLLVNPEYWELSEWQVELVQQVARECAIAIRQARVYQTARTRVAQLEKHNRLKDDYLSATAHELLNSMSNMRLTIQTLQQMLPAPSHIWILSCPTKTVLNPIKNRYKRPVKIP